MHLLQSLITVSAPYCSMAPSMSICQLPQYSRLHLREGGELPSIPSEHRGGRLSLLEPACVTPEGSHPSLLFSKGVPFASIRTGKALPVLPSAPEGITTRKEESAVDAIGGGN